MAPASLILGILGLLVSLFGFGLVSFVGVLLGVPAIVLGILARKRLAVEGQPTGTATAGMVLGVIAVAVGLVFTAACMYCSKRLGTEIQRQTEEQRNSPALKQELDDFERAIREPAPAK